MYFLVSLLNLACALAQWARASVSNDISQCANLLHVAHQLVLVLGAMLCLGVGALFVDR